ncbi:hypothetical protein LSH36_27g01051 [Paralvinella palmiformis]|uniref:Uncharacterized protein n=1 Tax=Paralvinella palmiformis TaxID=53620 RepID=A0AAD9K9C3_9ANNE|nr:hypothetical protein LSH36_27g01051 [Paralvinella palmiformis]
MVVGSGPSDTGEIRERDVERILGQLKEEAHHDRVSIFSQSSVCIIGGWRKRRKGDNVVKYLNEKRKSDISEDERALVDSDYEARKHLKFEKSVYDPPGGAANGRWRTNSTSRDDVSITSLSDFIPPYKLRHRRRLLLVGISICVIAAILLVLAVGIHFGTQKMNAVYLNLQGEDPDLKFNASCSGEYFLCKNISTSRSDVQFSGFCIPRSHICDRTEDCPDGADERNCSYACGSGQFTCTTGVITRWPYRGFCLEEDEVCNGEAECSDGSDERGCVIDHCGVDEFRCEISESDEGETCLSKRRRCDREPDCVDGSDEANCNYSCPDYEFMCTTGTVYAASDSRWPEYCLNAVQVCDGIDHCVDRSDELNCTLLCSAGQFFCREGFSRHNTRSRCVEESLVCNRRSDCTDSSDEVNCTYTCPSGMEACRSGTLMLYSSEYCYRKHKRCDSFFDCVDGSDEEGCEVTCSDDEFACRNSGQSLIKTCIPKEQVCDQHPDCSDGSDEESCEVECPKGQMSCEDDAVVSQLVLTCIPLAQKCDGNVDCPNGRDERDCKVTCNADQFQCVIGVNKLNGSACLEKMYTCDRVEDCADGSDEQMCQYVCSSGMIQCESGTIRDPGNNRQLRGYCLPDRFKCDGKKQCSDGSDEARCPCSGGQFMCLNGRNTFNTNSSCISSKHRCDGMADCTDRSDEINCTYKRYDCTKLKKTSFTRLRCDGLVDCHDGEDEKDCDITCSSDQFRCASSVDQLTGSVCIKLEYKCDRVEDCLDGSDENDCEYRCPDDTFMCTTEALYDQLTGNINRGYCIPEKLKCDGQKQCVDASDEMFCSCPGNQFRCRSGRNNFIHTSRCIPEEHVCDKFADCSDRSDELDCAYNFPTCDYFDTKLRCNGIVDCANGEDEQNCDRQCSSDEFRCKTGVDKRSGSVCIKAAFRCDRFVDCVDESDEDPFSCNYACPRGTLPCESGSLKDYITGLATRGYCFQESSKCDGIAQCMDKSDEDLCPCMVGEFRCSNGFNIYNRVSRCIALKHRCDGTPDCSDSSDEVNCF